MISPSPTPTPDTGTSLVLPQGDISVTTFLILVAVMVIGWALGQLAVYFISLERRRRLRTQREAELRNKEADEE